MKFNWKLAGVVTTILGGLVSLAANYVEEKKQEELVREQVIDVLAELNEGEES